MKYILLVIAYLVIIGLIWGLGTLFANKVSSHEVIEPSPGVKCVVVSRMFNTSVDCWKTNEITH